jgi:hypothetical protein
MPLETTPISYFDFLSSLVPGYAAMRNSPVRAAILFYVGFYIPRMVEVLKKLNFSFGHCTHNLKYQVGGVLNINVSVW